MMLQLKEATDVTMHSDATVSKWIVHEILINASLFLTRKMNNESGHDRLQHRLIDTNNGQ